MQKKLLTIKQIPNFKSLGQRLGKDMKTVAGEITNMTLSKFQLKRRKNDHRRLRNRFEMSRKKKKKKKISQVGRLLVKENKSVALGFNHYR